jgi:hypothetical protein
MRVERWVFSALMTSRARCGRRIDIRDGWVAQLAEQWTENPRVGGSIPPPATIFDLNIMSPLVFARTRAT